MLRVIACITDQHDLRLVLLAGLICAFASYTALGLLAHAASNRAKPLAWLSGSAVVFGAGVWATHFVAELAFQPGLPTGYDIELTALSILLAVGVSSLGFAVVQLGRAPALGGSLVGASIGSMHYVGMAALHVPADMHWDVGLVLASLAIAVVFGAASLEVNARGNDARHRALGASLLVLASCGLHFTAMAAVTLVPNPLIEISSQVIDPQWMAVAIAAVTVLIVALALSGSVVDRLRAHVAALEATRAQLVAATTSLEAALEKAEIGSEAKSQFLAAMSHELRTPLNAVIGFSEILATEMFGPLGNERYRNYAGSIRDSGRHLLGLINDILDISKLDAGRLELEETSVDLRTIVGEAMRMMQTHAIEARVRVYEDLDPALPALRADPRRVRQIVLNLLSNAIKFTPPGGEVRVSAAQSRAGIALKVTDTGIGIAREDIPKALERFGQIDNRLARRYQGTGLGLPLSKRLAELHGGTLELESAVGQGTTVTICFPADRLLADETPPDAFDAASRGHLTCVSATHIDGKGSEAPLPRDSSTVTPKVA
jgi:signal transduction histidine kinase